MSDQKPYSAVILKKVQQDASVAPQNTHLPIA